MFNIDSLALKETTELQLVHPTTEQPIFADKEEKKPVAIVIHGTSSKKYRNAITAMQNRQLKRDKKKVNAELLREESVALLVACSEKALNFNYKGEPLDTPEAFAKLYNDPTFSWLKDQVDAALGDVSRFLDA